MSETPIFGMTEWAGPQASPWLAHNASVRLIEALVRASVSDRDLDTPPGSCDDGAAFLIAASATGAWAGHDGELAVAAGEDAANGWLFAPVEIEGFRLWVDDEVIRIEFRPDASPPGWTEVTGEGGGVSEGTAFPGSPSNGQRFYRTDRAIEYFWNNAASLWLSTALHWAMPTMQNVVNPLADSATPMAFWRNPWAGIYEVFIERVAHAATLSGTGNWTVGLYDSGSTPISVLANITSSDFTAEDINAASVNHNIVRAHATENSGSASVVYFPAFSFRLVG